MPQRPADPAETRAASFAPDDRPPTFAAEQLVADRFRIVRFIARGGMGEVYEAVDLELNQHLALKTIRAEIAQDERAIARFKREAFLSRQVTHPNICRLYDLFIHRLPPADGGVPSPPIPFVTMQLLHGQTLADRLRESRLTVAEALPLAVGMAQALDAAHEVGVVHRDFKTTNVMLVPQSGGPRPVVTDFGMAWRDDEGAQGGKTPPTLPGELLGTPDYMAPEQLEGREVTPATDVYALGLVLYEMVTGARPFEGGSPIAAAARRLTHPPRPPRQVAPDLPPVWEAVILRCLQRRALLRFQRAGDVIPLLRGDAAPRHRRHPAVIAAAAAALAAGLIWIAAAPQWRARPAAAPVAPAEVRVAPARRSVAVLGFRNVSGRPDAAWLSTAFAEMLTTELAAGEQLRTIPGENIARMKMELALADADTYAPDTLGRIRDSLGADLVVLGSFVTVGRAGAGTIRLDARLQDSRQGTTLAMVSETGAEGDVLSLVARIGRRLRERLQIEALPPAATAAVEATRPATLDAVRLYAEGLERLRQFDALAARERLERAVAADARFPLAHAALAMAWSTLGYDERARAAAAKAFELSSALSREDRLSVEATAREMAREWKPAVEIYQTLFRFFPDNIEYGLRLANAQVASGAPKEALATLATLRAGTAGAPPDPRIDLADAAASEALSDWKRMLGAARAAAARGSAQGARLLVARAKLLEGTATMRSGDPERALALFEEARATFEQAGDRGGLARALNATAGTLLDRGEPARATEIYARALPIARAIGHERTVAQILNNAAITRRRVGDLDGSLALNREALAIRRRIGDRGTEATSLNNIGNVLLDKGDLAGAAAHYDQAAAIFRTIGDRGGLARALNNAAVALKTQGQVARALAAHQEALAVRREIGEAQATSISLVNVGELLALRGDLAEGTKYLEEALAMQRRLELGRGIGFSLHVLGQIALMQGDTALARARLQEAIDVRTKLGEKGTAAEGRVELARVALAEGRAPEAEQLARSAIEVLAGQNRDYEAGARVVLSKALLAAGRTDAAAAELARARELTAGTPNAMARLTVAIAAARLQGLTRPQTAAASIATLQGVEAEARKMEMPGVGFEAALAQAEVAVRQRRADADARIAGLIKDARARGFGLYATRAAALRSAGGT